MTIEQNVGPKRWGLLKRALRRRKRTPTAAEVDERNPYGSSHASGWDRQLGATYRGGQS